MRRFFRWKLHLTALVAVFGVFFLLNACHQVLDMPTLDESAGAPSQGSPTTPSSSPQNPTGSPSTPSTGQESVSFSDFEYYKDLEISVDSAELEDLFSLLSSQDEIKKNVHLMKVLRDEIVPQAVHQLMATFPKTFGWMKSGYEVGIGLALNPADDKSFVASYDLIPGYTLPDDSVSMQYGLTVVYGLLSWKNNVLDEPSRQELESHVVHEMMHALMAESLTYGFMGVSSELQKEPSEIFPLWFTEGAAETVGGTFSRIRMEIDNFNTFYNTSTDKMRAFLERFPLTGSESQSRYQTGCLATLYLSYLSMNKQDMEPSTLAQGLDKIMSLIHGGKSLTTVIQEISAKENSSEAFTSLGDFESWFTYENEDVLSFVTTLFDTFQEGRGSILSDVPSNVDLLPTPTEDVRTPLFWLYVRRDVKTNTYNNKITARQMFKGGAATKDGVPGLGAPKKEEP